MRQLLHLGSALTVVGAFLVGGLFTGTADAQQPGREQPGGFQRQPHGPGDQQIGDRRIEQRQQRERQGRIYHGEVVNVDDNRVTVSVEDQQYVFQVPQGTALKSRDDEEVQFQDVRQGQRLQVWISMDMPRRVLLVTHDDAARHDAHRHETAQRRTARRVEMDEFRAANNLTVNQITNLNVYNTQGERLGDIEEVVIDTQQGCVRYVVLSFGGFLGFGDKLFAIPWEALTLAHERDDPDTRYFLLNVTEERLEQMPGFERDQWPAMADDYWIEAHGYHQENGLQPVQPRERDRIQREGRIRVRQRDRERDQDRVRDRNGILDRDGVRDRDGARPQDGVRDRNDVRDNDQDDQPRNRGRLRDRVRDRLGIDS